MKHTILGVAFAAALAVPAFAQDYTIMAPANPGGRRGLGCRAGGLRGELDC